MNNEDKEGIVMQGMKRNTEIRKTRREEGKKRYIEKKKDIKEESNDKRGEEIHK